MVLIQGAVYGCTDSTYVLKKRIPVMDGESLCTYFKAILIFNIWVGGCLSSLLLYGTIGSFDGK